MGRVEQAGTGAGYAEVVGEARGGEVYEVAHVEIVNLVEALVGRIEHKLIIAAAADKGVIAASANQDIVSAATGDGVIACQTENNVVAGCAGQPICAAVTNYDGNRTGGVVALIAFGNRGRAVGDYAKVIGTRGKTRRQQQRDASVLRATALQRR